MSATTIPAVLDWLVAEVRALGLEKVQVIDGQPVTSALANDMIIIGFSPAEAAVSAENSTAGLDNGRSQERYTIHCLTSSLRGGTNMQVVRDRAFVLLDAVAGVLAKDATCGGAVLRARVAASVVDPMQTSDGASCTIMFDVEVVGHTVRAD